jgi:hypothetical protein
MFSFFKIFTLIYNFIRQYSGVFVGLFGFYLVRKNLKLIYEKQALKKTLEEHIEINKSQEDVIQVQEDVIQVINNTKDVSINDNIKRMRKKDL